MNYVKLNTEQLRAAAENRRAAMTTPAFRAQEELDNIREYFEDRQDASMEPGEDRFHGNKEMSLLQDLERVENSIKALCDSFSEASITGAALESRLHPLWSACVGLDCYDKAAWISVQRQLLRADEK